MPTYDLTPPTAVGGADPGQWAVRALTLFLFLETLLLAALGAGGLYVGFLQTQPQPLPAFLTGFSEQVLAALVLGGLALGAVAVPALIAAVMFLLQRRIGWTLATTVQSLVLAIGIALFFFGERLLTFAIMGIGIFMVAYLHHPDVQTTFQTRPVRIPESDLP